MPHDLVIRGGLVLDGSGADPIRADVAVDGGYISEVGEAVGKGRRELAADGRYVAPGFVDIHTHLDAQIAWDPIASSSCWHGITSVVLGNCGVTFAPCRPRDRRYLAEVMESVEDIPADTIMEGLEWTWETYGEYLQVIDRTPKGVNAGGMVGHCALRWFAMGSRSLEREPANDEDISAMVALADEALASGALGISTSRTLLHRAPGGHYVPGTFADHRELAALGSVLGRHGSGVFEAVPSFVGNASAPEVELDMLTQIARSSGRPVTFTLIQEHLAPDRHLDILAAVGRARAERVPLYPQTTARGIGIWFGLVNNTPFDRAPAWKELRQLKFSERLAMLRSPSGRTRLIESAESHPSRHPLDSVYPQPQGEAQYEFSPGDSLAAAASQRQTGPAETFIDLTLEQDGSALFLWPFLNDDVRAVHDMLASPFTVLGLADAGAHVGQIMDASQPTWFLSHWVRDRGLCSVGEGVRQLTSVPAQLFGVSGRGSLAAGSKADITVFDLDGMSLPLPEFVHDFPGGAGRFVQRAQGYAWSVVNGEVFIENGHDTGALAGQTLRNSAYEANRKSGATPQ